MSELYGGEVERLRAEIAHLAAPCQIDGCRYPQLDKLRKRIEVVMKKWDAETCRLTNQMVSYDRLRADLKRAME